MFSKEYVFKGIHADKVKRLTSDIMPGVKKGLFLRNLDVYILAPIVGFLYKRKASIDKSQEASTNTTKIFPEQLINARDELMYNYRLIVLLDEENESNPTQRIKHAFEYAEKEKGVADELLYDDYVRGGVDVLYEKLIESSIDTIANLYDFMEEFNERYASTISDSVVLDLLKLAKGY